MSFNDTIGDSDLTTEEFETAFKSLKRNKVAGTDTINSSIVLDTYNEIKDVLFLIFKTSLQQVTFPDKLKIVKSLLCRNQVMKKTLLTIGLFQFFQYFQKFLRESCAIKFINT